MSASMNLLPSAKVDLFSQSLHLPCQVHNEFDADNVETTSGPQIFNAAQNAYGLIIKIPATARGIHHRRHKSVSEINCDEAPGRSLNGAADILDPPWVRLALAKNEPSHDNSGIEI